jgi:hypothetical protein
MKEGRGRPRRDVVAAACLAPIVLGAAWSLYGDVGLNLADEGFLWYGASRTLAGEVPLRDFQSYEPGRYYWIALWSPIVGDGLLGVRRSIALFEVIGLAAGLQVARRVVPHPAWLLPIAIGLVLWMFPGYKGFEPALAMVAVYAGVRLVESPDRRTAFGVGLVLGMAAFFGRNHALYGALGMVVLVAWLAWREPERAPWRRLWTIAAGGCIGSIPLLAMIFVVPGFAASLWDSVVFFVEHGANLPKPVPWPWRADYHGLSVQMATALFVLGMTFLLVPLVYALGVALALRRDEPASPARAVLVATTAIGVFYLHHAAIRSDAAHLAQAIHPALLACLAIPAVVGSRWRTPARWAVPLGLVVITLTVPPVANLSLALPGEARTAALEPLPLGGDTLRVPPGVARYVSRIERVAALHFREGDTLFVAPFTPGLYCVLGKRSPVWGLYFLWKADPEDEEAMIQRFEAERLDWALISTGAIDGREELRFWNSHPRVWAWLEREFEVVRDPGLPRGMLLLGRPDDGDLPPLGRSGERVPESG